MGGTGNESENQAGKPGSPPRRLWHGERGSWLGVKIWMRAGLRGPGVMSGSESRLRRWASEAILRRCPYPADTMSLLRPLLCCILSPYLLARNLNCPFSPRPWVRRVFSPEGCPSHHAAETRNSPRDCVPCLEIPSRAFRGKSFRFRDI